MAKKIKYDGQDVVATYAEKDKKGVDLTDRVTATTNQTISGNKSFSGSVEVSYTYGINIKDSGYIYGDGDDYVILAANRFCLAYSKNDYYVALGTDYLEANRTIQFPDKSGTIALTSDIPSTSNFVTTTGNQNVGGVKTFAASPQIKDANGNAYINFNSDYYSGLVFRGYNSETTGQPLAAITYDADYNELTLYCPDGVYCNGGLYETNSRAPYFYGYRYVGKVYYNSGTSTSKCSIHIEITTPYNTTPTSSATLRQALYQAGYTSQANCCPAVGIYNNYQVVGMYASTSTLYVIYITSAVNATESYASLSSSVITYSFKKIN